MVIPIVTLGTPELEATGIVANLARPEGNVTGFSTFGIDIIPKRIEILKEIVPHLKRLAVITQGAGTYVDPKGAEIVQANVAIAARTLKFTWQTFLATAENDYDEIFARLEPEHFDAVYLTSAPLNIQSVPRIVELALRYRIPSIAEISLWSKGGLLVSYGQDFFQAIARASEYVDKILRGAKPSELPVERATKFEQIVNLKTAKAIGITIPPSLVARADVVIE